MISVSEPNKARALFLDRDGVVNVDKGYVHRVEGFEFIEGIFDLCRIAQSLGYKLILVTNQAGIARGHYREEDFHSLNQWMLDCFRQQGVDIARVYYCPYHPVHGIGMYRRESNCRKPNPGMILKARADFDLDLVASILVGDKETDIEAGERAGVGYNILIDPSKNFCGTRADLVLPSTAAVADWMHHTFHNHDTSD